MSAAEDTSLFTVFDDDLEDADEDLALARSLQLQEILDSSSLESSESFGRCIPFHHSNASSSSASGSNSGSGSSHRFGNEGFSNGHDSDSETGEVYIDGVGRTCDICQEYRIVDSFIRLSCGHSSFCMPCLSQYAISQVDIKAVPIKCPSPGCRSSGVSDQLLLLLPAESHCKALNLLMEMSIGEDEKFFCPYRDCSLMMVFDCVRPGENSRAVCGGCKRDVCISCQVAWHEGATCQAYQAAPANERDADDWKLKNLASSKGWKRCYKCNYWVERKEGCPHMTCRCKAEFCYGCGKPWVNKKPSCRCY